MDTRRVIQSSTHVHEQTPHHKAGIASVLNTITQHGREVQGAKCEERGTKCEVRGGGAEGQVRCADRVGLSWAPGCECECDHHTKKLRNEA